MNNNSLPKRCIGQRYENLAAKFLQKNGVSILTQNFVCRFGEIDLIARDNDVIAFIEVRFRRHHLYGGGIASVDMRKQSRIIKTANWYLKINAHLAIQTCRFDVIATSGSTDQQMIWVKDAFRVEV